MVFFDVDGTLVPSQDSCDHIAAFLGHHVELAEAQAAYEAGAISSRQWERIDAQGWAGRTRADLAACLNDMPLVDGIADVVAWCRENQVVPVLATLAWTPVGEYLCDRFGFAEYCGARLAEREGVFTGSVDQHFDEYDKREYARRVAAEAGFTLQQCAAVGDGASDVPLFQDVGFGIAFNAKPSLRAVASTSVEGDDLRIVLPPLKAWLGGGSRTP